MFKLSLLVLVMAVPAFSASVDSALYQSIQAKGNINVIVSMASSNSRTLATLEKFQTAEFASRSARINSVVHLLKREATQSQAGLLNFLSTQRSGVSVSPLWITNKIILRGVNSHLLTQLSSRSDISKIVEEKPVHFVQPIEVTGSDSQRAGEQWGVSLIHAPTVWEGGVNGSGIIISHIDSGVRGSHLALRTNHRQAYGWYDPGDKSDTPNDQLGHGTHTMGTMIGTENGVGVAPGSQWISCKACTDDDCYNSRFLECGQWILCPTLTDGTNEDCSKAPHVVSNSWGGARESDPWYDDVIAAWRAAKIVPLFSAGNSGPSCETILYPADNKDVIAVASTTATDELSVFSSTGPTFEGRIKPEIAAPGSSINSCSHTSDTGYTTKSGTSMASPHAAGLAGLLLSKNDKLTFDQVKELLQSGAVPTKATGMNCGDIDEDTYPNCHVGHGRIDAANSVANIGKLF